MTFDDILDQVIDLLKRQGRVSYPALKIRFSLDDEYLEALKAELLYVHPVRDDEGRGLVWAGNVEGTMATPAPPPQSTPHASDTRATVCPANLFVYRLPHSRRGTTSTDRDVL